MSKVGFITVPVWQCKWPFQYLSPVMFWKEDMLFWSEDIEMLKRQPSSLSHKF